MPAASPGRRPLVTVLVLALAAVAGAAVMFILLRPDGSEPAAQPSTPSTSMLASAPSAGDAVAACTGGSDPAAAVIAAMRTPATADGAAQAAAAVVRFAESKAFGTPAALQIIKQIADSFGSPTLVEMQKGQAPYVAQMTTTTAQVGRGAFVVTSEMPTPLVTVLTPVEWATTGEKHLDWSFTDVKLQRLGDRWAVVSAPATPRVSDALQPLRGAAVQAGDLDRYGAVLAVEGFRRYAGDC